MLRTSLRIPRLVRQSSELWTASTSCSRLAYPAAASHPPCVTRTKSTMPMLKENRGLLKRMFRKIGILDVSRSQLKAAGVFLYDKCSDQIDLKLFREELGLPDTMFSWFLITELHCWILMTRAMTDGDEGKNVRNSIIESLWDDVGTRMKILQIPHRSSTLSDFSQQFQAAIINYDEGLQSGDVVLAGALWRRLLSKDREVRPENLEMLVSYVRKQVAELDKLPSHQFYKRDFTWISLKNCKIS